MRDLCSMMMRHSDNKEVCSAQRARGNLKGGLTYIAFGEGPPLVVFPGLGPSNANPTGVLLRFEMGWLSPLARTFTVYRINRMVGLAPDTTMADLAPLRHSDRRYVRGSHRYPRLLDRRIHSAAICSRSPRPRPQVSPSRDSLPSGAGGTRCPRRHAQFAASGQYRRSLAALAPTITGSALGRRLAGAAMWLAAPLGGMGPNWDPSDMIATVEAEDAFDASDRLREIRAPTLVIGGERDPCYSRELFEKRHAAFRTRGSSSMRGVVTAGLSPIGVSLEMSQPSLLGPSATLRS